MADRSSSEAGFSLLEVMVALAVFSLGALALLNILGESTRSQSAASDRALARIVAENQLVQAMAADAPPSPGQYSGEEESLGRQWAWEMTVAPSPDPAILRIDVRVRAADGQQTVADLSTFRSAP
jgi:general secretion pathway protein I